MFHLQIILFITVATLPSLILAQSITILPYPFPYPGVGGIGGYPIQTLPYPFPSAFNGTNPFGNTFSTFLSNLLRPRPRPPTTTPAPEPGSVSSEQTPSEQTFPFLQPQQIDVSPGSRSENLYSTLPFNPSLLPAIHVNHLGTSDSNANAAQLMPGQNPAGFPNQRIVNSGVSGVIPPTNTPVASNSTFLSFLPLFQILGLAKPNQNN